MDLNEYDDPRQALMDWVRDDPSQYFARSFVNRVWAAYFGVGIVNPPDDLNLANPPSNRELLDYLTQGFVDHGYDMKWLHREIARSRTYQLTWKPNETNRLDTRNFSRAVPRRLPAEVAYDAIVMATAGEQELQSLLQDPQPRAIGGGADVGRRNRGRSNAYVFTVFGKPAREVNCDCERSTETSLLQTIYLRNDQEMLGLIERGSGWYGEVISSGKGQPGQDRVSESGRNAARMKSADFAAQLVVLKRRLKRLENGDPDPVEIGRVKRRIQAVEEQAKAAVRRSADESPENPTASRPAQNVRPADLLIDDIYLRTVSRFPTDHEKDKAERYIQDSASQASGIKDLLWAMLNTKEFIVNH